MAASHTTSKRNPTEQRALELLGSGLRSELVANACGVTVGRISQLLADPEFAEEVSKLRVGALQKHNVRDNAYDGIEDDLIAQFRTVMPMMMRPGEILKGIQVINAAKRRGQSAPEAINQSNVVVTIVMPTKIIQTFTTNTLNQVVRAGDQELVTIQSGQMSKMAAQSAEEIRMEKIKEGVKRLTTPKVPQVSQTQGVQHDRSNETDSGY